MKHVLGEVQECVKGRLCLSLWTGFVVGRSHVGLPSFGSCAEFWAEKTKPTHPVNNLTEISWVGIKDTAHFSFHWEMHFSRACTLLLHQACCDKALNIFWHSWSTSRSMYQGRAQMQGGVFDLNAKTIMLMFNTKGGLIRLTIWLAHMHTAWLRGWDRLYRKC